MIRYDDIKRYRKNIVGVDELTSLDIDGGATGFLFGVWERPAGGVVVGCLVRQWA